MKTVTLWVILPTALVLGCNAPQYAPARAATGFAPAVYVEKASPNPFRDQRRFVMLPVRQDLEPRRKYFDARSGRQIDVSGDTADDVSAAFAQSVIRSAEAFDITVRRVGEAPDHAYVIRPVLERLDNAPMWHGVDARTRQVPVGGVEFRVFVESPDGTKDEILVTERRFAPTSDSARLCGESAIDYLQGRVSGKR